MRRIVYSLACGLLVAGVLAGLSGSNGSGAGVLATGFLAVLVIIAATSYVVMAVLGLGRSHRPRPMIRTSPPQQEPDPELPAGEWPAWYGGDEDGPVVRYGTAPEDPQRGSARW